jgi:TldD protein
MTEQTNKNQNPDSLFFKNSNLDNGKVDRIVSDALNQADDGELYLQFEESESFVYDDQRLKSASFDVSKGFGLRAVSDESTGYAHSSDIDEVSLKNAANTVGFITKKK